MTIDEDDALTLRNIAFRSEQAHQAAGNKAVMADVLHALHILATGLEELTRYVAKHQGLNINKKAVDSESD